MSIHINDRKLKDHSKVRTWIGSLTDQRSRGIQARTVPILWKIFTSTTDTVFVQYGIVVQNRYAHHGVNQNCLYLLVPLIGVDNTKYRIIKTSDNVTETLTWGQMTFYMRQWDYDDSLSMGLHEIGYITMVHLLGVHRSS